jgi:hypothetical protein
MHQKRRSLPQAEVCTESIYMPSIIRSTGLTTSEQYLAKLADKTFLNLWSYPNLYRDVGKELCDLLVVCGNTFAKNCELGRASVVGLL